MSIVETMKRKHALMVVLLGAVVTLLVLRARALKSVTGSELLERELVTRSRV